MKKFSVIWTIAKKEFSRFFKDKRMLATLFLPGLLIYVLYSFIGGTLMQSLLPDENYTYRVCVVNAPEWLTEEALAPLGNFELQTVSEELPDAEEKIKNQELDAYLVFPNDFALGGSNGQLHEVKLYANSAETNSAMAAEYLTAALSSVQFGMPNFLLTPQDVATEADVSAMVVSMLGPMLVLVMLMTGCVAVAPESIAGEKERGSFATMLVTPVNRSYIALGKVLSLSAISLLSGISSAAGVILALPKLMGDDSVSLAALGFGVGEILALLGIVLSSVLIMVAVVSILSAWAKSVKEATAMISPVMIVVLVCALVPSFLPMNEWFFFCIPLLNSSAALTATFSMAMNPLFVVITVLVNLLTAGLLMWALSRMFCSEKIMFSK